MKVNVWSNYYCTCCLYGVRRNDFDGENLFRGLLEGVGPENQDFMPQKVEIRAHPFQWPKRHRKNRYIGKFRYMSFAASVFCIL
jgi:hypothetical protein